MLGLVSVDLSELLIRKIEDYRTQHSKKKKSSKSDFPLFI